MNYKINVEQFRDLFNRNTDFKNKYSYHALEIIFNWYEENDPNYNFDMGEITGSWSNFVDFSSLENNYYYLVDNDVIYEEIEDEQEKADYLIKELEYCENAIVQPYNNGQSFVVLK